MGKDGRVMTGSTRLSLIVPTLNAAETLPAAIAAWRTVIQPDEIIVSDGGSSDTTRETAEQAGAIALSGPSGRGRQLANGAERATGDWLLFVHADTLPGANAGPAARAFMGDPANALKAAAFHLTLDDEAPAARRVERLANWRARRLGLAYGDQGLLIARESYWKLGGFQSLPLMEDVEFVRRLGRANLIILNGAVMTSAARYRRDGYWKRPAKNIALLCLYFLGLSPERLARMYR